MYTKNAQSKTYATWFYYYFCDTLLKVVYVN